MTNAELIQKIKAEIERRLKDYWKICFHDVKAYNEDSNVRELKELLSFLSTLESEKPVPNDLEEAANHHICKAVDAVKRRGWELETQDIADAFIAGYNLCREQMLKEAVEGEFLYTPYPTISLDDSKDYNFTDFDRVRVIILKKED